jgi:hypothetical protein
LSLPRLSPCLQGKQASPVNAPADCLGIELDRNMSTRFKPPRTLHPHRHLPPKGQRSSLMRSTRSCKHESAGQCTRNRSLFTALSLALSIVSVGCQSSNGGVPGSGGSLSPDGSCAAGQMRCSNECVDLGSNSSHCGSCNNACDPGQSCSDSQCICAAGRVGHVNALAPPHRLAARRVCAVSNFRPMDPPRWPMDPPRWCNGTGTLRTARRRGGEERAIGLLGRHGSGNSIAYRTKMGPSRTVPSGKSSRTFGATASEEASGICTTETLRSRGSETLPGGTYTVRPSAPASISCSASFGSMRSVAALPADGASLEAPDGDPEAELPPRLSSSSWPAVLAPDVIRARSCRDLVVMMEPTEDRPRDDPTRIRAGCPWCYGWYGNLLADPLVRSEGIEVL